MGIGLRVAGRMAGQRIMGEGQTGPAPVQADQSPAQTSAGAAAHGRAAGQATRGVAKGVGGFLRPFQKVGGKIWLEVTGVFFLLMAFVFAWYIVRGWNTSGGSISRTHLIIEALISLMFLYLGIGSFWRARKE